MDLVPPLRHLGRLVPFRCRLARRSTRISTPRRRTHRRHRHRRAHRPRTTHPARRPRHLDDIAHRRPTPRRSRCHPLTLKTPRLQRQPVLRSPIQNPEEHTPVPRTLHQPRPRTSIRRRVLRALQPSPPPLRHRLPHTSHLGHHTAIRAHRQAVLDHAYATDPHRFRRPPIAPRVPAITRINPPETNLSQTA